MFLLEQYQKNPTKHGIRDFRLEVTIVRMSKLPSIALIHGWATEPTIWDPVCAELEAAGHRVTVYEMPGYGSRRAEKSNVTVEELAQDAIEKLKGCDVWVGWSLGAMIALKAAAEKPTVCRGIFAVCPTAKFCCDTEKEVALQQLLDSVQSDPVKATKRFRRSMASPENRKPMAVRLREMHPPRLRRPSQREGDAGGTPTRETLFAGLEILKINDLTPDLAGIKIPVRILSGALDPIIPCSSGKELHRQIANSTYTTLPCGHVPFLECLQQFMEQLFEFTQTIPGSSADSEPV